MNPLIWSVQLESANFTIRIKFPLDFKSQSKNRKYISTKSKVLNPAYKAWKEQIAFEFLKESKSHKIEKTKSLITIFVIKNTEKGDIHNLIEGVCDGIKLFTQKYGLDDNLFEVACAYQIVKEVPEIISIGFTQ